jgi:hypothetical protein
MLAAVSILHVPAIKQFFEERGILEQKAAKETKVWAFCRKRLASSDSGVESALRAVSYKQTGMDVVTMKKTASAVILFLSCVLLAHADTKKQRVYLVEQTSFSQTVSYRIMEIDNYKALRKQTSAKNRLMAKALKMAKKEWEAAEEDSEMGKKRFPGNVAKPAKVKSLGMFSSKEKAQVELDDILMEEQRKEEQRSKKQSGVERQIEEIKKHLKATQADGQMDQTTKAIRITNFEMQIETLEEELAQREAKKQAKEYSLMLARELFDKMMNKLIEEKKNKHAPVKEAPAKPKAEDPIGF